MNISELYMAIHVENRGYSVDRIKAKVFRHGKFMGSIEEVFFGNLKCKP